MADDVNDKIPEDPQKKSGQQLGRENIEALRAYIESLKLQGKGLPSRNGVPNKTAIALACGFRRQVFETNEEAARLLKEAVVDLDLDSGASPQEGKVEHTQKRLDSSDRRVRELEEKLALKNAEIEKLRQENKELRERVRQLEAFEEVMTTSGRRFIP